MIEFKIISIDDGLLSFKATVAGYETFDEQISRVVSSTYAEGIVVDLKYKIQHIQSSFGLSAPIINCDNHSCSAQISFESYANSVEELESLLLALGFKK